MIVSDANASLLQAIGYYIFLYPIIMSVFWVIGGLYFWWRRELHGEEEKGNPPEPDLWPALTILVPCYNEAAVIDATCQSLYTLDYPDYHVIFIDDASSDETSEIIGSWLPKAPFFHLLRLEKNQGKALALNSALYRAVNEPITVVIDADTLIAPKSLKWLVKPFVYQPRLGAVTGNPMAFNRTNLLEKVQVAEFASIIGLIKRAQRVLGRVLTVSGCIAAYRTNVLKEVGGFSPRTATEDIDITWVLQRHFYEVWYAPQAVAFIQVPSTLRQYWKQRCRWARGGWHLLRTHKGIFSRWRWRRSWPVYIDFVLSHLWSFFFVLGTLLWIVSYLLFHYPIGFTPIPAWYGAIVSVACLTQFGAALVANHRYDSRLWQTFFWVPWYPIFFFVFGSLAILRTAPEGLFGNLERTGRWNSPTREKMTLNTTLNDPS